jgi:hypothetical protein
MTTAGVGKPHYGNGEGCITEELMITYAGLRQRVLGKLSTEADVSDCERALYGIAHAAVSGGAEGATLDLFTSDRSWPLVEHAMAELEEHFANEIAELRRLLGRRSTTGGRAGGGVVAGIYRRAAALMPMAVHTPTL